MKKALVAAVSILVLVTNVQSESAPATKWKVDVQTDPIDDSKTIVFFVKLDSGEAFLGLTSPSLVIRVVQKKSELYVNWGEFVGKGSVPVVIRFDAETPITEQWDASTDGMGAFAKDPAAFAGELLFHSKLVCRTVSPSDYSPITLVFDIRGLRSIASQFKDELDWLATKEVPGAPESGVNP